MDIHPKVNEILKTLSAAGHQAFVVGGCVRDLLMGRTPTDWDITTDAKPERIQELFPDHFYDNAFGTVTVKTRDEDPLVWTVQITPFRTEGRYTDKRHPDRVTFAATLQEDLSRRDFTMNAIALDADGAVTDPYDGRSDIDAKTVRAVGDPAVRFAEDALRMLRAVRFSATLGFSIDPATREAIAAHAASLRDISAERIRDEFTKIIDSSRAAEGVQLLEDLGLLRSIIPELREGVGVEQNLHHIYTVWEHNLRTMAYAAKKGYSFAVRIACLLHDVGKPRTKRGEGRHCTFYAHDAVGARMARSIMGRLKYPSDLTEKVVTLVRYHMFYYSVGEVTESSVRRLLAKVGHENIDDLLRLREGDRIGSGTPKAVPYKLRHLKYMIDKVSHDPISVKMLNVDGNDIMQQLKIGPGPKVGLILNTLLAEALDDPSINVRDALLQRAGELNASSAADLQQALERIERARDAEEQERMKKYYV
jgi:putative nucleotidyltransferase with HDIG domain